MAQQKLENAADFFSLSTIVTRFAKTWNNPAKQYFQYRAAHVFSVTTYFRTRYFIDLELNTTLRYSITFVHDSRLRL